MDMKNFTKKIKEIGAISTVAVLSIYGANAAPHSSGFPQNFIEDGKFNGEFVVGSMSALDSTLAIAMIDKVTELSKSEPLKNGKMRIIYSGEETAEDYLDITKQTNKLNYGETLEEVSPTNGFDDGDTNFLNNERFKNGISDEDYKQTLKPLNGEFNYALRDKINWTNEITDGVFYNDDDIFMRYTLSLDNPIDLTDTKDLDKDITGSILTILGNEFTVVSIQNDGKDLKQLELLGGADKIFIKENEAKKVSVNDKNYEIFIKVVSEDKVSFTINGKDKTLNIYESEDLDGMFIGITDLIEGRRSNTLGSAELIIGGQKITLGDGGEIVQINNEDIDDIYNKYYIESDFSDGNVGMQNITITYYVYEDTLLNIENELKDVLFNSFRIRYYGLEDITYDDVKFKMKSDDTISLGGRLYNKNEFDEDIIYTNTTDGSNGVTYFVGENDEDRVFYKNSNLDLHIPQGFNRINTNTIEINFTDNNIRGNGFLMFKDFDENYLYKILSLDREKKTIEMEEVYDSDTFNDIRPSDFSFDVDIRLLTSVADNTFGTLRLNLSEFGNPYIVFEDGLVVDVSNIESNGFNGHFTIFYNDINGDSMADEDERYNISFGWDSVDSKPIFNLDQTDTDFVNKNNAYENEDDKDIKIFITSYGTKIEYDTDRKDYVKIYVPNEQVDAELKILFGKTLKGKEYEVVVDEIDLEDKKKELIDKGYKIIRLEDSQTTQFNNGFEISISAPLLDTYIKNNQNKIIIGGPAVNKAAAQILNLEYPTYGPDTELHEKEAVIRYINELNSLLIYGYEFEETKMAVERVLTSEDLGDELFLIR